MDRSDLLRRCDHGRITAHWAGCPHGVNDGVEARFHQECGSRQLRCGGARYVTDDELAEMGYSNGFVNWRSLEDRAHAAEKALVDSSVKPRLEWFGRKILGNGFPLRLEGQSGKRWWFVASADNVNAATHVAFPLDRGSGRDEVVVKRVDGILSEYFTPDGTPRLPKLPRPALAEALVDEGITAEEPK